MDLLAQYSDDDVEATEAIKGEPLALGAAPKAAARRLIAGTDLAILPAVDAAPDVDLLGKDEVQNYALNPSTKRILTNPSYAALSKPLQGPVEVGQLSLEQKFQNHKMGHVEKTNMRSLAFDEQYLMFHNFGYAANPARSVPEDQQVLESTEALPQHGRTIWDKAVKRRRVNKEDGVEVDKDKAGGEMWGGFTDEAVVRKQLEDELREREEEVERQKEEEKAVEGEERETKERVTSAFHGGKETDFSGRSWMENKTQMAKGIDDKQCFLPKKMDPHMVWPHHGSSGNPMVSQVGPPATVSRHGCQNQNMGLPQPAEMPAHLHGA